MSKLTDSLRRLFLAESISVEKLEQMLEGGKITAKEFADITVPAETEGETDEYKQYYETVNAAVLGGES